MEPAQRCNARIMDLRAERQLGNSNPLAVDDRVADRQDRVHVPHFQGGKRSVDVIWRDEHDFLELHAQSRRLGVERRNLIRGERRPSASYP